MACMEVSRVEISGVIRRWRAGHSQRRIASGTGLSRDIVARYITAVEALGVSRQGPEPSEEHSAAWRPSASWARAKLRRH